MEDKDWTVRANVRELVASHGKILQEAANNNTTQQAQLDINDDLDRISNSLPEEESEKFLKLYVEETEASVAQLNQSTAQLNAKTAEIEVKTAVSEASANYVGSVIGAIIAVTVIFLLLREFL